MKYVFLFLTAVTVALLLASCDPISPRFYEEDCKALEGKMAEITFYWPSRLKKAAIQSEWICLKSILPIP